MFNVEKIQLHELSGFMKSDKFKGLKNKPMSSLRAVSYINNPKAKPNDTVLYMAFDKGVLVGYRTIWRDTYSLLNEAPKSFGWLSGNWVHENYRRKGISTLLFDEVYKDWEKDLMYTNYAVNSKLLYDKTARFQQIKSLKGTRFYMRFCLADILVNKHNIFSKLKRVLVVLDCITNFLLNIRLLYTKQKKKLRLTVKKNVEWNSEMNLFLKKYKENEFFKRDEKLFNWIKKYPWVETNEAIKKESLQYYFTLYVKGFKSNYYTFYDDSENIRALVWLNLREGHLKIPYVYFDDEYLDEVVSFLIIKIKEERVKSIVIYNSAIENKLNDKIFFIAKKRFYQNFYATTNMKLNSENIETKEIQSGNGDVVFT